MPGTTQCPEKTAGQHEEAMPSDFDSYIVARVDQLEAGQRRLRWRVIWLMVLAASQGAFLLYLLLPVGRLGIPKYVEASRFVLVDDDGRLRGGVENGQWARARIIRRKR